MSLRDGHGSLPWPLVALALLLGGCADSPPPVQRVVLVTIDTLRADHVGCYGAPGAETPNLDRLAAEGARFEVAISPVPLTLPSHTTILTGLLPPSHGVRSNSMFQLAEDIPLLPEGLVERGFASAAFVGAVVLDRHYGLARGFDVYNDEMGLRHASGHNTGFSERRADQVVDAALGWLQGAPERFLLWVHLFDPHDRYDPPAGIHAPSGDPYDAEIKFADQQVGRLRSGVDARYRDGHTLYVVTSDHGESLGEHDEPNHSLSLYDATQRVPLLMAGAGLPAGRIVSQVTSLADLTPTILDLAGVSGGSFDGRSLRDGLEGRALPPRPAYLETLETQLGFGWSPIYGARSETHKFVLAPRPELYELSADPLELEDTAAERPETVQELSAFIARVREAGRPIRMKTDGDPERIAQLQSLGYVVPGVSGAKVGQVGGIDPKDGLPTLVHTEAASRLATVNDFAGALLRMERVLGGGPQTDAQRAHFARRAGKLEDALQYADSCVAVAPSWGTCSLQRGLVLWDMGREAEAEMALRRSAEIDPADASALSQLGWFRLARGDLTEAAELLEQALAAREGSSDSLWRLATVRILQGRLADADALLASLPAERLLAPGVVAALAKAEIESGEAARARARLQEALQGTPNQKVLRDLWDQLGEVRPRSFGPGP